MIADFQLIKASGNIRIRFYEGGFSTGSIVVSPERFSAIWDMINNGTNEKRA